MAICEFIRQNFHENSEPLEIVRKTLALAESWQNRANTLRSKDELKQQQMMRRLPNHPSDKTVVMHLVDQSFSSKNPQSVVDQFNYLLQHHGIPKNHV